MSATLTTRRLVIRLSLVVVAMFGFGFALVPIYDVMCQAFGINGKTAGAARVASEVEKEIYAHGVSVVEIKRGSSGTSLGMVRGSRYNRRITSATWCAWLSVSTDLVTEA